jgi:hypothetical protein
MSERWSSLQIYAYVRKGPIYLEADKDLRIGTNSVDQSLL